MPLYKYSCPSCNHKYDEIQSFAEGDTYLKTPQTCKECGETHEHKRIIEATSFKLAGGGWFKNSYR